MSARCPQCGFKADLLTETQFHICSQCGAGFRVYDGLGISEQYIRHDQNDAFAWGALLGALDAEGCRHPEQPGDIKFGYHPFWFADLSDGNISFCPATSMPKGFPLPSMAPVGALEFTRKSLQFPQASLKPETLMTSESGIKRLRLLQIPLYLISYQVASENYQATVSGSTWQTYASSLPKETGIDVPLQRFKFLGVYMTSLFLTGLLAPNFAWRAVAFIIIVSIAWSLDRSGVKRG